MKRKPSPAQIAARERFAAMARSGAFKKKAAKARSVSKKVDLQAWMDEYDRLENENMHSENVVRLADLLGTKTDQQVTRQIVKNIERVGYLTNDDYDRQRAIYKKLMPKLERLLEPKSNPAKKTVSQKISQLTREGYPQKQAVAIALNEERAGKVRRNPISDVANIIYNQLGANRFAMMTGAKNFVAGDDFLMFSIGKNQSVYNKVRITLTPDDLYDVEFFKMNRLGDIAKEKKYEGMYAEQLPTLFTDVTGLYTSLGTMGRRSNPRASNPINSGIKYACIMPEPGGMAYGIDERTPVTIRFSASELKRAYKCYLIPANVRESAGYKRLIAKQKEVYMSLAELKQLFRSFV